MWSGPARQLPQRCGVLGTPLPATTSRPLRPCLCMGPAHLPPAPERSGLDLGDTSSLTPLPQGPACVPRGSANTILLSVRPTTRGSTTDGLLRSLRSFCPLPPPRGGATEAQDRAQGPVPPRPTQLLLEIRGMLGFKGADPPLPWESCANQPPVPRRGAAGCPRWSLTSCGPAGRRGGREGRCLALRAQQPRPGPRTSHRPAPLGHCRRSLPPSLLGHLLSSCYVPGPSPGCDSEGDTQPGPLPHTALRLD